MSSSLVPPDFKCCINTDPDPPIKRIYLSSPEISKSISSGRSTNLLRLITVHPKGRLFDDLPHKFRFLEHTWSIHLPFYLCQRYSWPDKFSDRRHLKHQVKGQSFLWQWLQKRLEAELEFSIKCCKTIEYWSLKAVLTAFLCALNDGWAEVLLR